MTTRSPPHRKEHKPRHDAETDLVRLRTAASPALPLAELSRQRCVACGGASLAICRYPAFKSAFFAGLILARCDTCGLAWVPVPNLDLETYYTVHYAEEFRPGRGYTGAFFGPENPVWSAPAHKRRDRARRHAEDVGRFGPFRRVLDLGAGEGMFLHAVAADKKYAVELDAKAIPVLENELGVTVQALEDRREFFDLVVSSHSLEHFTYDQVEAVLAGVARALRPGGHFYVEVPPGAHQLDAFAVGRRPKTQRLEPHTLFFSIAALLRLLRKAGFDIVEASICKWTLQHMSPAEIETLLGGAKPRSDAPPLVVARRPA